ncbi:carboxypeptidase regulatory-like domain-containing protein [Rubrivirga sp.]|uniref:carboxypeptidase-like regulatory domain-containing protein n=1 Tax=Rubrivirga sp. TaxID=1885344 RepID=UPI003C76A9DC
MRLFVLFFALALAPAVSAQLAPSDFVIGVQTADGEPIAGATVQFAGQGVSTDARGEAVLEDVQPGRYPVRVSFVGLPTREIAAVLEGGGPWGLIVEMADSATLLLEVVVEGRDLSTSRLAADGFFQREALGGGTILRPDDIERRNPITVSDILRGGVLGVRVQQGRFGEIATSNRRGTACRMDVYLDGTYSPVLTEALDAQSAQGIVAVEVYRGATQVPLQYRLSNGDPGSGSAAGCGVVLLWSEFSLDPSETL